MDRIKEKKFQSDCHLVEKVRQGDKNALEELFFEYYPDLCTYAFQMIKSAEQAEDIVQEVFYNLWKGRKSWHICISLKAYLFQSVRNHTLNYIEKSKHYRQVRDEFAKEIGWNDEDRNGLDQEKRQLVDRIWTAVYEMPQRRQSVFVLHQKHGLSYKEIADVLNIKRKTVENHMGFALSEIRERLDMSLLIDSST
ncbi:MAG TPA: RNA polymerase sigma-70 factor [Balneolaceae bacterium]